MTDEQQRPRPPQPGQVPPAPQGTPASPGQVPPAPQGTPSSSSSAGQHGPTAQYGSQYGAPTAAETTQQIPVAAAPSAQGAGAGPASATGAAGARGASGTAGDSSSLRTILHVLALVLVAAGISLPLDGDGVLWRSSAMWAAFVALAALAQLVAVVGRDAMGGRAWSVGAAGAAGLVLAWTLLMLPVISTNMAFLVTMGTAAAVAAVLMSPDRRI